MNTKPTYKLFQEKLKSQNQKLPCAFVDLKVFDQNIDHIVKLFSQTKKTVRVATKSIRVPDLLRRILNRGFPFKGLMNYSAHEIEFLSEMGFDDFWLAYPIASKEDALSLKKVHQAGKKVKAVVDSIETIELLTEVMQGVSFPFEVILDVDVGYSFLGIHLGAKRSPLRSPTQLKALIKVFQEKARPLKIVGLQAYEAHVAGMPDQNPFKKWQNPITKILKYFFAKQVVQKRISFLKTLKELKIEIKHFNGGGTGSADFNLNEETLTEISIGSAFYCPLLFDYYSNLNFNPALFFALPIVRIPESKLVTCQGGGYIASGEMGLDRLPRPVLPDGAKLLSMEGAGEVQTPLDVSGSEESLKIGDPIFFRHSKAGELAEHFNSFLLLQESSGEEPKSVLTYRGYGKCF